MRTRRLLGALCCVAALLGASACSGGSTASTSTGTTDSAPAATADLVGPGCADYAKLVPSGAGSFAGMARDSVATAMGNNPLLTSLAGAVAGKLNRSVNMVDDLDSEKLTVFAPVDDAFAKVPTNVLKQFMSPAGAATLRSTLMTHLVKGSLSPASIDGTLETLAGGRITVKGSGDNLTVNGAKVICGGIQTSNATVYLVDSVLNPAGGHF